MHYVLLSTTPARKTNIHDLEHKNLKMLIYIFV